MQILHLLKKDFQSQNEFINSFNQIENIKNNTFCIKNNKRKYILKFFEQNKSNNLKTKLTKKLKNRLFNTSCSEIENIIYNAFNLNDEYIYFNHPHMYLSKKINGRTYLILEFINNNKQMRLKISERDLTKALFEFQFQTPKYIDKNKKKLLKSNCFSKKTFKQIFHLFKNINPRLGFKCINLYYTLNKKQKFQFSILAHNDLGNLYTNSNLIVDKDNKVYLIDFENSGIENRWVLSDILSLAFSISSFEFNCKLISSYLQMIKNYNADMHSRIILEDQLKAYLLMKMTYNIVRSSRSIERKNKCYEFLVNVLLNEDKFNDWIYSYIENIRNNIKGGDYGCKITE